MKPLREVINDFKGNHQALGHFNFSDSNQLKAIAAASRETNLPVLAGLSEGEREFFPLPHARALVDQYQKEGVGLYLSADHTYSAEKARAAIDAGVDSIVVDGAKLPTQENVAMVKEVAAYARASGRDVIIEGELGYIGSGSEVLDALPEGAAATEAMMTTPEDAAAFVRAAGTDAFAPAVGNIHGMVKSGNPKISPERIAAIAGAVAAPLVLHGGSGITDEEFKAAVAAGIAEVHINTQLRLIYRDALREALQGDGTTPYKFLTPVVEKMTAFLAGRMRLFAGGQ